MLDLVIVRAIFILVSVFSAYALRPFDVAALAAAAGGLVLGAFIIFFEIRLEQVSLKRLIGAASGRCWEFSALFSCRWCWGRPRQTALRAGLILLLMTYVGLIVGAKKGDMLNLAALGGFSAARSRPRSRSRSWTPA